jgi:hypothetical protein
MITYSANNITPRTQLLWNQTNAKGATYTLRGSVLVRIPRAWPRQERRVAITDLHPFAQGYADAMLADALHFNPEANHVSFSMIHGPTLLRLMRDCAQADPNHTLPLAKLDHAQAAYEGMCFWVARLNGKRLPFRPLTPLVTRSKPSAPPRIIFGLTLGALIGNEAAADMAEFHLCAQGVPSPKPC